MKGKQPNPFLPVSTRELRDSPGSGHVLNAAITQMQSHHVLPSPGTVVERRFEIAKADWQSRWWKPTPDLDIGPIRRQYYQAMCWPEPHKVYPFGNDVYLPEIRITRQLNNETVNPLEWFANDRFLAERLAMLGIGWLPIENAIQQAFLEKTELPYRNVVEARGRLFARASMFSDDSDKDRNILIVRKLVDDLILFNSLSESELAAQGMFDLLRPLYIRQSIEWCKLYNVYTPPDLSRELIDRPSPSYSVFTQPVIRAVARTLFQEIRAALQRRTVCKISVRDVPGLQRVIYTVETFDGESGYVRNEYWQLVVAIVNHLAPTVLGVPLSQANPFSGDAMRKHCGRKNDQIAKTFGLER